MDFVHWGIGLAQGVLVIFSVIALVVMIERGITLRRKRHREEQEYKRLREIVVRGDTTALASVLKTTESPVGFALRAGMELGTVGAERLRESVGQEITVQTALLQRNFQYLATIASTAPYIGLFGTVLGILAAFRKIAASGETGAAIVAGGISEALVTTAIGLAVAIPAVIAYNQLLNEANTLSLAIENHAMTLTGYLADRATQTEQAP